MVRERTISRLSLYRRLLRVVQNRGGQHIFSHELANAARVTAAQVRRDIMSLGYTGSPVRGYNVAELIGSIAAKLDAAEPEAVALVGVGNLGRAIMAFFSGRRPKLFIAAAFDTDPEKIDRVIHGIRCYSADDTEKVVREQGIRLGIIAVPASRAQDVTDQLVRAGVRGILNFAPLPLRFPPGVYVEALDMTSSLEKVAYFARQEAAAQDRGAIV